MAKKLYHANCATEAKSIRNWQNIIAMSSEASSLKPYFGDGYVVVKGGVAIHILKCDAIQATVDFERQGCFSELPIKIRDENGKFRNESYWAHPVTKVLLPKNTPLPCHPKLPMVYKLDGLKHHYCSFGHGLTQCPDPDIITPTSANLHNQLKADIAAPMGAGVMTNTQARQIQFRVFHHQYAHHIEAENLIKNKDNVETGNPLEIIPSDRLEKEWKWDIASAIAPFYGLFGNIYVYVIGIIMLCTVIGATCGLGARLYMELTINGFTYRLFFAIFQGLYHIATVPLEFIKSGYRGTVKYHTQGIEKATEPLKILIIQLQDQINQINRSHGNYKAPQIDPDIDLRSEENPFNPPSYYSGGGHQSQAPPIWDMRQDTPSVFSPLSQPQPLPPMKNSVYNKIFNRKAWLEYRDKQKAQQAFYDLEAQPLHVLSDGPARIHRPTAPPPPQRQQSSGPYQNVASAVRQERTRIIHSPDTFAIQSDNEVTANATSATSNLNNAQQAEQFQEDDALFAESTESNAPDNLVDVDNPAGLNQTRREIDTTLQKIRKP